MTTINKRGRALSVLFVSTFAFTVCSMVWMFAVIGVPIKKTLSLSATEFGFLNATPVLTGSLIRVPLGIWTDKYGGRIVMTQRVTSEGRRPCALNHPIPGRPRARTRPVWHASTGWP